MLGNPFRFEWKWVVEGTLREVSAIIGALEWLPAWWPSVYIDAERVAQGNACGVGNSVDVRARAWLPISSRYQLTISVASPPGHWEFVTTGGVTGSGRCTMIQVGPRVILDCDWQIAVRKPFLRGLAPVLGPIIAANLH